MKTLVAATALLGSAVFATPAQAEPLAIALDEAISGTNNATGHSYLTAVRYALDKFNADGGLNGEKVLLTVYDNSGSSAVAANKAKQAIADGVRVIIQGTSSAIAAAIADVVNAYNADNPGKEVLFFSAGATAMTLTGEKCGFYNFRYLPTAPILISALVTAMKEDKVLGTRVYAINQNYSWGQDVDTAIKAAAPIGGYEVVDSVLHEVNRIQDFAPFVARIDAAKPDTVITGNWSNDLLLLMKAVNQAKVTVRFGTLFLDQEGNISNAGPQAIGNYLAHSYNPALTDGRFAEDYKKTTGRLPVYIEPPTVRTMQLLLKAIHEAHLPAGTFDATKVALALENVTLTTDLGPITIRKGDHQVFGPVVVSRAERGAKYPVDGTDIGFRPVKLFPAGRFSYPVQESCHMKRPS